MENLINILNQAGESLGAIVQISVYIVGLQQHAEIILKLLGDYFKGHLPTSTVVGITGVVTDPRLILEITAVAVIS